MGHIKRLAELYDVYVDDLENLCQVYRKNANNAHHNQTLQGLCLEYYCGLPSKVWTPWGYWHFGAGRYTSMDIEGFEIHLRMLQLLPEHSIGQISIGPIYAILAIDDEELPQLALPIDCRQFMEHEAANAEWDRLFETS